MIDKYLGWTHTIHHDKSESKGSPYKWYVTEQKGDIRYGVVQCFYTREKARQYVRELTTNIVSYNEKES